MYATRVGTIIALIIIFEIHVHVWLVSRSQTPPLFDIWTAGRESGALALKLSFRELPEVGSGY